MPHSRKLEKEADKVGLMFAAKVSTSLFSTLMGCWCRQVMAQTFNHIKGNIIFFVLIHSGIVNGYQLLCDAHTVLEPHRGTAVFVCFTHYRPFQLFNHREKIFFLGIT